MKILSPESCPDLSRRFVAAEKTRARFCSSKCSALVRVNRARGKIIKSPKDTGQATMLQNLRTRYTCLSRSPKFLSF